MQTGPFDITITFSEDVTGFVADDIDVDNGAVTTFSGSGTNYKATVMPTASETVAVNVPENAAQDGAGNGNEAAEQFSVIADVDASTGTSADVVGTTLVPASGLTTTEAGGTASFAVVLNSQPTSDITINLSSSDITEGAAESESITFTPTNWNIPQTVTVTGIDDDMDDSDQDYTIKLSAATSGDPNHDGIDLGQVALTNIDDDVAGITVTPISGMVMTETDIMTLAQTDQTIGINGSPTSRLINDRSGPLCHLLSGAEHPTDIRCHPLSEQFGPQRRQNITRIPHLHQLGPDPTGNHPDIRAQTRIIQRFLLEHPADRDRDRHSRQPHRRRPALYHYPIGSHECRWQIQRHRSR